MAHTAASMQAAATNMIDGKQGGSAESTVPMTCMAHTAASIQATGNDM
jgi:hypothetical protein